MWCNPGVAGSLARLESGLRQRNRGGPGDKVGLGHRRLDCQGNTWPSPSSEIVWKRKALPVWVGSGEALASQLER